MYEPTTVSLLPKLILIWELVTKKEDLLPPILKIGRIHNMQFYISTCFGVGVSLPFCRKMLEGRRCSGTGRRKEPVLLDLRRPSSQCNNRD
jgi:hypothetical protein